MELRNNKVDKQADGVATGYFTDEYMGWRASNFTAGYISTAKLIVDGVVKDRWTELKRFVALLKDGGNVNVWYHYDLTKFRKRVARFQSRNLPSSTLKELLL